ncbi:Protein-tyrosine phosphatase catalytic [Penicillium canariense]|uniref:phosphatidylinositol-3,4,5-trisphosphate 3-phosphatase n=1 Tax=Penicillium canariense TaxID=189055 RepID=A0A9W9LTE8_9EURO|nr:Protein-tyrosine phosphatase catalytic [Penicillium canariense]KAJ5175896.1 Protein-tyrosine phosphatase catalytic [Penicillium canariense]
MSSILRQIVAGPRLQHAEAGLDLCYVTDNIIATSGPSATYPQRAYRNPLDALVTFLDSKHGENWCIWEFRAEGTGYPDSEVYGRIHHFPWPDHHPPPFGLIPNIMGSMRNWVHRLDAKGEDTPTSGSKAEKRVAVVHCKAGKGRSGTIATAYLISEEGWKKEDALQRFTERRMRVNFGDGVSIPSQLRYVGYIDRWTNQLEKQYVERPVEILEIHIWGLRDGVKVAVEGYVDEGKKIKCFHLFHRKERTVVEVGEGGTPPTQNRADSKEAKLAQPINASATWSPPSQSDSSSSASELAHRATTTSPSLSTVIFRPTKRIIVPQSDVNIDFERRSKVSYTGFAMVTSVAHVWFNAYFEGGAEHDSGIFEIEWDAMDGIKGSARKGIRAFERLKVVWRYPSDQDGQKDATVAAGRPISEPKPGEPVPESVPADWRGKQGGEEPEQENKPPAKQADLKESSQSEVFGAGLSATASTLLAVSTDSVHELGRQLGLRKQTNESKDVSLAGSEDETRSVTDDQGRARKAKAAMQKVEGNGDLEGVQSYFQNEDEEKEKEGKEAAHDSKGS